MKVVAIVQARMGSTRLPNKVIKEIGGQPMIEILLKRLSKAKYIDEIVLATSTNDNNFPLVKHVSSMGFRVVRGSEDDVLNRYLQAINATCADVVVRVTGDCPLIDPDLVDHVIDSFKRSNCDYFSNNDPVTYPDGLDIEVFQAEALRKADLLTNVQYDREHVTPYLRNSDLFTKGNISNDHDFSFLRWTVDEANDFNVVKDIFDHFSPNIHFSWKDVIQLYKKQPKLFSANSQIKRNEGALMGNGQKLWKRAKNIIPGGNMLLSKRAEMFLPEQWPTYFSKSKGCQVWDLDGREYTDMSIMGIGTNILGYGHPLVDEAVKKTITAGNMSTLNCPEEVYLAEKLIELHPWADMVRLARSGGEANAIAIRIARASSGKDGVAFCGYHGWHDWYLSANLGEDQNLSGHLLPGLEPNGVPKNLRGTVFPFEYNDFEQLKKLVGSKDIGVIKMEVSRNEGPQNNFLQKVRKLADQNNIVLIFDECTSGFRQTFGGLHKHYGVEPDMAMFGKALGNGYAITATIGRREVMEAAQSTFISSTFWTERIGPAAALKTLEVMEQTESWKIVTQTGLKIRETWQQLANKYSINIEHWGLPALTGFSVKGERNLAYKTLITQEMLKKGYLAGNSIYVSVEHTEEKLEKYFDELDPIFKLIKECEDGRNVHSLLDGPVCHDGFRRLN
jgi:glutamate-1-semialdehyde 2,1-aminomutase